MEAGFEISESDFVEEPTEEMITLYRSLIGSIGYAAVTVRFDVSYALSVLSRHLSRPNARLIAAVDGSFAMCKLTRRSHFGYTTFLNRGLISWKSHSLFSGKRVCRALRFDMRDAVFETACKRAGI